MSEIDDLKRRIKEMPVKTVAAQLRPLLPLIDTRLREGVRQHEIVDELRKCGIDLKLNTFRTYLYRYRDKQQHVQSEPPASAPDSNPTTAQGEEEPSQDPSDESYESRKKRMLDAITREDSPERYANQRKPIRGRKYKEY